MLAFVRGGPAPSCTGALHRGLALTYTPGPLFWGASMPISLALPSIIAATPSAPPHYGRHIAATLPHQTGLSANA